MFVWRFWGFGGGNWRGGRRRRRKMRNRRRRRWRRAKNKNPKRQCQWISQLINLGQSNTFFFGMTRGMIQGMIGTSRTSELYQNWSPLNKRKARFFKRPCDSPNVSGLGQQHPRAKSSLDLIDQLLPFLSKIHKSNRDWTWVAHNKNKHM